MLVSYLYVICGIPAWYSNSRDGNFAMLKINILLLPAFATCALLLFAEKYKPMDSSQSGVAVIDGPYVSYRNDSIFVNYIEDNGGTKSVKTDILLSSSKDSIHLLVNTGEPGKTFPVILKSKLSNEKPEYNSVKKMLVLSDIEGNFTAFRQLLQGNGVIDENFNWTFGEGHLVLVGDFVDRGTMVMEVLWLIYSLEEKAKAAGGYVHYILGNHEIMNMSGDLRYVQPRYPEHAALMKTQYTQLFGPDTELGRWLSTKNVVERIGKILFMHGGISGYVNELRLSLKDLNNLVRPHYRDTVFEFKDPRKEILLSDLGPFWYRGYYAHTARATTKQIDSTLNLYGVRHITTGHTIIADQIMSLYDGRLFDTDVHHAGGHSEALLMDNGIFYRVNASGQKFSISAVQGPE